MAWIVKEKMWAVSCRVLTTLWGCDYNICWGTVLSRVAVGRRGSGSIDHPICKARYSELLGRKGRMGELFHPNVPLFFSPLAFQSVTVCLCRLKWEVKQNWLRADTIAGPLLGLLPSCKKHFSSRCLSSPQTGSCWHKVSGILEGVGLSM